MSWVHIINGTVYGLQYESDITNMNIKSACIKQCLENEFFMFSRVG